MPSSSPYGVEALEAAIQALPRIRFAQLPTPLEPYPRLSDGLGVDLLVKRDDLTGLAFGGNKTRNLEFRLPEALTAGCDTLVLSVQATSNSARQTAAAGNKLGLRTVLFLRGCDQRVEGNLLIDRLLGAEIHCIPDDDQRARSAVDDFVAADRVRGHRPFVLNDAPMFAVAAAVAYLECWLEVRVQLERLGKSVDRVYITSGGKGQAGLELARAALHDPVEVVGISVSDPSSDRKQGIVQVAERAAQRLGLNARIDAQKIVNDRTHVGPGYGRPTDEAVDAIRFCAQREGLLLDPVYTGKGMAALIADARSGRIRPGATVVFIHTGGLPALFSAEGASVIARA